MKTFFTILISLSICKFIYSDFTFKNFEKEDFKSKEINVGFYPLGKFDSNLLFFLKKEVEVFYKFNVLILKGSELPSKAYYKPRNRYKADTLLDYLLLIKPKNIDYIVGLTEKDISCAKGQYSDWGVFGLGFMPGESCIVSSYRLKPSAKNEEHFYERLSKVVIHELGHNFGLDHCSNSKCIMRDAEGTVKSVDNENKALCESCVRKLKVLLK